MTKYQECKSSCEKIKCKEMINKKRGRHKLSMARIRNGTSCQLYQY
jgi:hypothetical protein